MKNRLINTFFNYATCSAWCCFSFNSPSAKFFSKTFTPYLRIAFFHM